MTIFLGVLLSFQLKTVIHSTSKDVRKLSHFLPQFRHANILQSACYQPRKSCAFFFVKNIRLHNVSTVLPSYGILRGISISQGHHEERLGPQSLGGHVVNWESYGSDVILCWIWKMQKGSPTSRLTISPRCVPYLNSTESHLLCCQTPLALVERM